MCAATGPGVQDLAALPEARVLAGVRPGDEPVYRYRDVGFHDCHCILLIALRPTGAVPASVRLVR